MPPTPLPAPPGDRLAGSLRVDMQIPLLDANDRRAAKNRASFAARRIQTLDFVSSPGAGKTTLLGRTLDACLSFLRATL